MFNSKQTGMVTISEKEYRNLLMIKNRVDILRAFYFNQPAELENHVTINSIFSFDDLHGEGVIPL